MFRNVLSLLFVLGTANAAFLTFERRCEACLCASSLDLPVRVTTVASGDKHPYSKSFCGHVYVSETACSFEIGGSENNCVALGQGPTLRSALLSSRYDGIPIGGPTGDFMIAMGHPHIAAAVMFVLATRPSDEFSRRNATLPTVVEESEVRLAAVTAEYEKLGAKYTLLEAKFQELQRKSESDFARIEEDLKKRMEAMFDMAGMLSRLTPNETYTLGRALVNDPPTLYMITTSVLMPDRNAFAAVFEAILMAITAIAACAGALAALVPRIKAAAVDMTVAFVDAMYPASSYLRAILGDYKIVPTHYTDPVLAPRDVGGCPFNFDPEETAMVAIGGIVEFENGCVTLPPKYMEVVVGFVGGQRGLLRSSNVMAKSNRYVPPIEFVRTEDGNWGTADVTTIPAVCMVIVDHGEGIFPRAKVMTSIHSYGECFAAIPHIVKSIKMTPVVVQLLGQGYVVKRSVATRVNRTAFANLHNSIVNELALSLAQGREERSKKRETFKAIKDVEKGFKDAKEDMGTKKHVIIDPVPNAAVEVSKIMKDPVA